MRLILRLASCAALLTHTLAAHAGGEGGGEAIDAEDGGPTVVQSQTPDPTACAVSEPGRAAAGGAEIAAALVLGFVALRRRK